jgi:DNA-directed RNA polymerase subunit E'/Rpb7
MMAYSNPIVEKPYAKIIDNAPSPYLSVNVKTIISCWCPRKGMIVVGRVTRTGLDHIALVVHGLFNASIPKSEITEGFTCKNGNWRDEKAKKDLVEGCFVRFRISKYVKRVCRSQRCLSV